MGRVVGSVPEVAFLIYHPTGPGPLLHRPGEGCVHQVRAGRLVLRTVTVPVRAMGRCQPGKYLSALVSELPRRNGWTMAEQAGDRSPDRMQRLLNRRRGTRWP